jgi:hypothetical protein
LEAQQTFLQSLVSYSGQYAFGLAKQMASINKQLNNAAMPTDQQIQADVDAMLVMENAVNTFSLELYWIFSVSWQLKILYPKADANYLCIRAKIKKPRSRI